MHGYRVKITDNAFLQTDRDGKVVLLLNEVLYEPADVLARKVAAPQKKTDARTFVLDCVIHEYGPNKKHWPEIAQSFLAPPITEATKTDPADNLPEGP